MTADQLGDTRERFAEQGYVLLRGALPAKLCSDYGNAVIAEYRRLTDAGWSFTSSGRLAGHLNLAQGPSGRELLKGLEEAGVPRLIADLAPEPLALAQAAGNLNLPGSAAQDYHIDGDFAERTLIANICLVPTDERNGATALVPASDRAAMPYWRFRSERWAARAVRPALQPGDVLIRPSTLWHRGTPNLSDQPRPMAAFVWADAAKVDPAAVERELAAPLTIYGNKYYGRWRRAKEFATVRLPWFDEGLRLARSVLFERGPVA